MIKESLMKPLLSFPRTRESRSCRSYKTWIPAFAGMTMCAYFFLFLLAFCGCETVVSSDGLPYVDHIVIRGFLNAGQPVDSISVTHTLPLNVPDDPNQATVPTAQVSISVDGNSIPLQYIGFGLFSDPANDTVQSGKTYSIDVKWNGLHAFASTLVPQTPDVDSTYEGKANVQIYYDPYYQYSDTIVETQLEFGVRARTSECYSFLFDSTAGYMHIGDTMPDHGSWGPTSIDLQGVANEATDGHVWLSQRSEGNDSLTLAWVTIGAFDASYYDFIQTYGYNSDDGDPFGTGSANPKWNVSGDGIGIFIGEAQTKRSSTFHR
jgi:hypothetical protein